MTQQTMKALVYEGPRIMNMREVPVPEPQADEVLIRVEVSGICGSELGGYLGHNSLRKPPLIMGHEFAGTVAAVGSAVRKFKPGDRVTANPLQSCGDCRECRSGNAQLCPSRRLLGAHVPGSYAEYTVVQEKNVYPLPDHVSFDEGAFVEPFACAVHICNLLQMSPADRLLIVGAGPIGLFTLQAAQVYGLRDIVVVDLNEKRLEIAAELGGHAVRGLDQLPDDEREFDVAVDAVGAGVTRLQCVRHVKPAGKVVFTGLHEAESTLPINDLIRSEVHMFGAFAYTPLDFEMALKWIAAGRVNLLPWTVRAPLAEGGPSFEKLINDPGKIAKILLTSPA